MAKFKKPLLFALSLLPIAIIAGVFVIFYQIDIYSEEIISEIVAQFGSIDLLIAVSAVQAAAYAFVCAFFGYIFADKLGLIKPIKFEKRSLLITLAISAAGGIVLSLDHWVSGSMFDGIQQANAASLTAHGVIAAVIYGGVVEELMLRLFFMSLVALIVWKLFFRKYERDNIPEAVFVCANIVAALLFAAGHLPATQTMFGELTPLLLFRCFLLNGGFGLVFGWVYRKYGIHYAMAGHAMCHITSKLIWFIFI